MHTRIYTHTRRLLNQGSAARVCDLGEGETLSAGSQCHADGLPDWKSALNTSLPGTSHARCVSVILHGVTLGSSIHHFMEEPNCCQYPSAVFRSIHLTYNSSTCCKDRYSLYPPNRQQTLTFSLLSAAAAKLAFIHEASQISLLIWNLFRMYSSEAHFW